MTSLNTPVKYMNKDFKKDFNYPIETNEKGGNAIKKKVNIKKTTAEKDNQPKITPFLMKK